MADAQDRRDELAPGEEGYEPGSLGTGGFQDVQPLLDRVNTAFGVTGTNNEFTHLNELTQVEVTRADGGGTMPLYDLATEADGAFNASSLGVLAATDAVDATASNAIWIGDGATPDSIAAALRAIDGAIGEVSDNRAGLGAFQNRMESTILSQIMVQAGIAMLVQANTPS